MEKKKNVVPQVVFIIALLIFIAYSFYSFSRDNNERIAEQNNDFIKVATEQKAERLNELIAMSERNLEMMVHLYPTLMTSPEVDTDMLKDMIERSYFDYVEFITPDGMDLAADGKTANLVDREYFIDGMKGNSGKCVVHNSRITNETLLIFYSPFYYDGEIVGVLSGIMRGDTMYQVLATDYFDVKANSYVVESGGNVILSSDGSDESEEPANVFDALTEENGISKEQQEKLAQALGEGRAESFNYYDGEDSEGSACIVPLRDDEWILVQSFPASVTRNMVQGADSAGRRLEMKLLAAFIVYLAYLIIKNQLARKKLVSEKQEMLGIVDAVSRLFTRFALVDYETDTYEYLKRDVGRAPEKGRYTELVEYLDGKYVQDDENAEKMSTVISRDYVREHMTEDVPYLRYEYRIDVGEEKERWENVSIICLERKNGMPSKVLYAIQDMSTLKEREMEIRLALKEASEAADAANRAKSDFLARMSHDIRTPMNAIMGMTAVAERHMDDRSRLEDCLSKINISSKHLLALINDVLDMSKIESGKVTLSEEDFNIPDLVDSVVTIIRQQAESKRQSLSVHIADVEHEKAVGDALRLRQILLNILGNAVKFTPEDGSITFSIREKPSPVPARVCYEFRCEDTGIGMDEEFLRTIFDPFTRSDASVKQNIEGTGLGMAITRNIVRMMSGDIQVESKVGEGSKFTVQVHLKARGAEEEEARELAGLHVLVVDDEEDSCVNTSEILDSIGMSSEWVLSGREAVERAAEAHGRQEDFAAIILDWKMPEMDGLETAREILKHVGSEVPFIILSAYDWSEIEEQAREAGIQAFVEKPLFRSRLVYVLKSVLKKDAAVEEENAHEESEFRGRRVLVVDDVEINREIMKELLNFIEVESEPAEDGKEALEAFSRSAPGYYDMILMDVQMPTMDGYEATRRIRALDRQDAKTVPVIAMTANAFVEDIKNAEAAGMNDHMSKPVEIPKLIQMMKKWL